MKQNQTHLTVDTLLAQLADESRPLSIASLYALSNLDRHDVTRVEAGWGNLPADRRRAIMRHLVDIAEANFEVDFSATFRIGLNDPLPEVREAAVDGLWEDQDPALVARFVDLAQGDPAEAVRATAALALGRFVYLGEVEDIPAHKAEPALRALREMLARPDEPVEVRRRVVEAIAFSSDEDVPGIIREAYQSSDEKMRLSAVYAMGNSADEQWIDTVISELESQSPAMRYEAAHAAGELEARNAVPTLARLLDDPDHEVQQMTVWALGQIGGDRAQKLLVKVAESDDPTLADAAADALEEMSWAHGTTRDMPLFVFDPNADDEEDDDEDEV